MANYFIAGRADDIGYARAERLADCMTRLLPKAVLTKFMLHPDDWEDFLATKVRGVLGTAVPKTSPVVWTLSGRLIGSDKEFGELLASRYGIHIDVSDDTLEAIVAVNVKEAQHKRTQQELKKKYSGRKALIIVDVQNDFLDGGALAVPGANEVIPIINKIRAGNSWDLVLLTQDSHPPNHTSFASNHPGASPFDKVTLPELGEQVLWPDHCVTGSIGARFHPYLDTKADDVIVSMGQHPKADSYSAFGDAFGGKYEKTELETILKESGIDHVFLTGIALDFCVAFTAKDAVKAGFDVVVIEDATRGLADESIDKERKEMKEAGVLIVESAELPRFGADDSGDEFKRAETAGRVATASSKRALVITGMQNDFCDGGALEVPAASDVIPVINGLRTRCAWDVVVFTQDSRPPDHECFASNHPGVAVHDVVDLEHVAGQTMWPDHCVQGSLGHAFHDDIIRETADVVVATGTNKRVDPYSAFGDAFSGKYEATTLESTLRELGIQHIYVCGLAADRMVSATAKEAVKRGFQATVVTDASKATSAAGDATERVQWSKLGVKKCKSADIASRALE